MPLARVLCGRALAPRVEVIDGALAELEAGIRGAHDIERALEGVRRKI
jgi:hypothetical protein